MERDDQISVIEHRFCVPYILELDVKKKVQSFSNAHYDVFDATGNVLLQVDGGMWNFQRKRVMKDPSGLPVITMRRQKAWNGQWDVYRGESSEKEHLLFTAQRSSALQVKNKLEVCLAKSYREKAGCDFCANGRVASLSFEVLRGNSIIAEVSHCYTWASCKGKESFEVKVYPEVDYAFIIALLVVMNENDT